MALSRIMDAGNSPFLKGARHLTTVAAGALFIVAGALKLLSMRFRLRQLSVTGPVALLVVVVTGVCAAVGGSATAAAGRPAPAEGADLLKRVQTLYGESRRAIRSVEFEYTFDMTSAIRKARYARDGDRQYMGAIWILESGGFSMPNECAWDGQRVHVRAMEGRLGRSTDRKRFGVSTPVPQDTLNALTTWSLGLEPGRSRREPDKKFRFLRGRTVEDAEHGTCIGLEVRLDWKPGTMLTRHARRYGYAPVYQRVVLDNGSVETEMSRAFAFDVRRSLGAARWDGSG